MGLNVGIHCALNLLQVGLPATAAVYAISIGERRPAAQLSASVILTQIALETFKILSLFTPISIRPAGQIAFAALAPSFFLKNEWQPNSKQVVYSAALTTAMALAQLWLGYSPTNIVLGIALGFTCSYITPTVMNYIASTRHAPQFLGILRT